MPDVIAAGRVDADFIADPILQQAIDAKKVRSFCSCIRCDRIAVHDQGWVTTFDNWNKNKAQLTQFYDTMQAATKCVVAHPADTIDVLAKFSKVDPAVIASMHQLCPARPEFIQPVIDVLAKYKGIAAAFNARELIAPGIT